MNFANLEYQSIRLSRAHSAPRRGTGAPPSSEHGSDFWPDISTELATDERDIARQKNTPAILLKEAVGAVLSSIGLVIFLIAVLQVFHAP
jgi:hypothetical protein